MHIEILSWPRALFWSNDPIILTISLTKNSKDESLSLVTKFILSGTVLVLDIGVHCLAKKLLNRFALSKKSITSLLSTSSGGISGILLPFASVSKMAQYVLGAVFGCIVNATNFSLSNTENLTCESKFRFPHLSKVGLCHHIK